MQESLTNIIKHAKATKVHVTVTSLPRGIEVEVLDNGIGFSPQAQTSGFGLAGMQERVYLVGGTLTVESGDGGTRVRAELPTELLGPSASGQLAM